MVSAGAEEDSQADCFSRQRRQSWARLLKKIYQVDPLTCPQCGCRMALIAKGKEENK